MVEFQLALFRMEMCPETKAKASDCPSTLQQQALMALGTLNFETAFCSEDQRPKSTVEQLVRTFVIGLYSKQLITSL